MGQTFCSLHTLCGWWKQNLHPGVGCTSYLYWANYCSLYWWMCWMLMYATTHQEQWCSQTLSSAEKSCGQDRVLRFSRSTKVRWERGIRITRLKPQLLYIRCEAKHEGDKAKVNTTGYDVDNVTISRSTNTYLHRIAQNSKRKTDSVDRRLANLFANGSALAIV